MAQRPPAPVLGIAAAAALAACANGLELRNGLTPDRRQHCRSANLPRQIPPAEALLDVSALTETLARLPRGRAHVSVKFGPGGVPARHTVVRSDLPRERDTDVERAVHATLKPQDEAHWGVRLELETGPGPSVEIRRQRMCQAIVRRGETSILRGLNPPGQRTSSTLLRVLVDPNGQVIEAEPHRGSGEGVEMVPLAGMLSFHPALEDGIPVTKWALVRVPIAR